MKTVYWVVSLLLHTAAFSAGAALLDIPRFDVPVPILQAELVPEPARPTVVTPTPEPAPPSLSPDEPKPVDSPQKAAPSAQPKAGPPPPPERPVPPARVVPKAAAASSTPPTNDKLHDTQSTATRPGPASAPPEVNTPDDTAAEGIVLHQGYAFRVPGTGEVITLKRGAEYRSLRQCAVREYFIEEYAGLYVVGADRYLSIVDGRDRCGGMVLHDSKTGLLRRLEKFGKMIYVYGPSVERPAPVVGSLTFLTTKENTEVVASPSRVMWDGEKPPVRFGTRLYFREEPVSLDTAAGPARGTLVAPLRETERSALLLAVPDWDRPGGLYRGIARRLARTGTAVLLCHLEAKTQTTPARDPLTASPKAFAPSSGAALFSSALEYLRGHARCDAAHVGIWAIGRAVPVAAALSAGRKRSDAPYAFFVATVDGSMPEAEASAAAPSPPVPQFWVFADEHPRERWLDALRSRSGRNDRTGVLIAVRLLQSPPADDVPGSNSDQGYHLIGSLLPRTLPVILPWLETR